MRELVAKLLIDVLMFGIMLAPNITTVCGYVHIDDRVTTKELDLLFVILNLIWTITNLDFFSILALSS